MPAVSLSQANNEQLALIVPNKSDEPVSRTYILYDAAVLVDLFKYVFETTKQSNPNLSVADIKYLTTKFLERGDYLKSRKKEYVVATITVNAGRAQSGLQYGVPNVVASAANKGYGPLMYDIVMAHEGGITCDKLSISDEAAWVWSYYYNNRKDVEKKLLDDISDPRTPEKFDDSTVFKQSKYDYSKDPLNYAYFPKTKLNTSTLLNNHEVFIAWIKKNLPELDIISNAHRFFDRKYMSL
jgi:hypothetical protein